MHILCVPRYIFLMLPLLDPVLNQLDLPSHPASLYAYIYDCIPHVTVSSLYVFSQNCCMSHPS
jgi:hypothetical protein